jgi:hypothetical protein
MGKLNAILDQFSVGYFRYAMLADRPSGPIESLRLSRFSLADGESLYQATASLSQDLIPKWRNRSVVYGSSTGTGTGDTKREAIFKAISECIERWAFYIYSGSSDYGFDIDDSTNGMACFPGLTSYTARKNAFLESVERWALRAWWTGALGLEVIPKPGLNALDISVFKIKTEIGLPEVVILHAKRKSSVKGRLFHSYGFAAGINLAEAIRRAMIELSRNIEALDCFYDRTEMVQVEDANEYRLLYFSSNEGNSDFIERTKICIGDSVRFKLQLDEKISGPWGKYTTVWRCLGEPCYPKEIQEREFFF